MGEKSGLDEDVCTCVCMCVCTHIERRISEGKVFPAQGTISAKVSRSVCIWLSGTLWNKKEGSMAGPEGARWGVVK